MNYNRKDVEDAFLAGMAEGLDFGKYASSSNPYGDALDEFMERTHPTPLQPGQSFAGEDGTRYRVVRVDELATNQPRWYIVNSWRPIAPRKRTDLHTRDCSGLLPSDWLALVL